MLLNELLIADSAILSAYVVGGIPTGYLIAKWWGIGDIRKHGSGNIGATNVARVLGKHFFFLVFFLDTCKASVFLALAKYIGVHPLVILTSAAALLLGNCYSPFLSLSGGKGVATTFGILLILQPILLTLIACIWLIALLVTHTVGIASIIAAVSAPLWTLFLLRHDTATSILIIFLVVVIIIRHADNLMRHFTLK